MDLWAWLNSFLYMNTLITIIVCVLIDLTFRWWAFKRFDSTAIDLSFVSFVVCVARFITINSLDETPGVLDSVEQAWLWRIAISFGLYFFISFIHGALRQHLNKLYSEKVMSASFLDKSGRPLNDPNLNSKLRMNILKILEHSIYLTFTTCNKSESFSGMRPGKREIRASAASLLTELTQTDFINADFEIGKKRQVISLVLFSIVGIASIITAILKVGV
jgi:hypothetical protein